MKSPCCQFQAKRFGKDRKGIQRYRCNYCGKTFAQRERNLLDGMYLSVDKAVRVLQMLIEGCSVSSIERMTGVHHTTILTLLVNVGIRCEAFCIDRIHHVSVRDVQCDELWGFVGKKEKACRPGDDPTLGDAYTFVAIERHSKLVLCWETGKRDRIATEDFISRLRWATSANSFQLTTDGFQPYINAIDGGLSDRVHYAQLIKVYRASREGEQRYSPAEVVATEEVPVLGTPEPRRICTSHVERQNLTMRMQIRRLTRLTNGFSKKLENHRAAIALHFAHYNFCRVHSSLRVTPAMEAGLTDHVWSIRELLGAI